MNRAINLPGKAIVIAQSETISGLKEVEQALDLYECALDQMPSQAALAGADIVVLEVDPADDASLARLDQISTARPNAPIIAGVQSLDIRSTRVLLKRGVTDVLESPFSIEELLGAIADVEFSDDAIPDQSAPLAPVITFIGCAGGVGTSTIATHVASAISELDEPAAMLDLDIQRGDVAEYLGMKGRLSLQDLFEADKRLDLDLLRSVLTKRVGFPNLLAAPDEILPIEHVDFDKLEPVIELMRRDTGHVFIDMPIALTNWGLSTLMASQHIVIVGGMSLHMLRKMRRQIDFLLSMGIDRDVIKVVANRVSTGLFKTIKTSEAEAALRHPIFAVVPEETGYLEQAQDQGELLWSISNRTKFEKAIRGIADHLLEETEGES